MSQEEIIKKSLKRMKKVYPGMPTEALEKELIPLSGEEVQPKVVKKKKVE